VPCKYKFVTVPANRDLNGGKIDITIVADNEEIGYIKYRRGRI